MIVHDGLLFRGDQRVRLEELPFRLLLVLLENPGEVVSKEVLHRRLWSDRIYGELDNVLQVAASKLREALGETASSPCYIETVRRRGYRFLGQVEPLVTSVPTDISQVEAEAPLAHAEAVRPRQHWLPWVAILTLVTIVAVLLSFLRQKSEELTGAPDEVVLGSFVNETGDPSYSGLGYALRVSLEESPYFKLAAAQPTTEGIVAPTLLARELHGCASMHGKVLISGSIASRPSGYSLTVSARNCTNSKLWSKQSVTADNRDGVLAALDRAALQMRASLGEPSATLQKYDVPLSRATTSSFAALSAFTLGEAKRDNGKEFEAIQDYKLATDLDPQFALAYARLGTIYSNAAEQTQSALAFQRAFELRERTTDRERLYIASHFYAMSGQTQRTIEAYELWRTLYPRDSSPYQNLALEYLNIGAPQKALGVARTAVQLDGASSISQAALGRVYLENGMKNDLQALCSAVLGRAGDSAMLHESCFLLAFERHDTAAMQEQIRWSRGNAAESELLDDVAWVAMYQGKLSLGRSLFAQARHAALSQGFPELGATIDADESLLEAEFGYPQQAKQFALAAIKAAPANSSIQLLAGIALARSGDTSVAESSASQVAAQAPLDTTLNHAGIPLILAAIQLQNDDSSAAIRTLEQVRPYDFYSALDLAPAYYRGLAHEHAGQLQEAALSFRSVASHLALMPDSPYGPLAAMHLGVVLEKLGDANGAAEARKQVELDWQQADPDFRPLVSLRNIQVSSAH